MQLPRISYERNTATLDFPGLTVWYSYTTPIAFRTVAGQFEIRENDWSNTTGKHLNAIERDHSMRISGAEFENALQRVCAAMSAAIEPEAQPQTRDDDNKIPGDVHNRKVSCAVCGLVHTHQFTGSFPFDVGEGFDADGLAWCDACDAHTEQVTRCFYSSRDHAEHHSRAAAHS